MAPPSNGASASARQTNGQRRVVPAIPLAYGRSQNRKRAETQSSNKEVAVAASIEKSDPVGDDEGQTVTGAVKPPMTPEMLNASVQVAEEATPSAKAEVETAESMVTAEEVATPDNVNGIEEHAVSAAVSEPQSSEPPTPVRDNGVADEVTANGTSYTPNGKPEPKTTTKARAGSFRPLKIPQELPPEFYPSEPSSTPHSGQSSAMRPPQFPQFVPPPAHMIHHAAPSYQSHRPTLSAPFNPEANFQPVDRHPELSRTPSRASSDRPLNGFDLQSPMIPRTPAGFSDPKMASALGLQDYMLGLFDHPALSDSAIDLSALSDSQDGRHVRTHALILYRSSTMRRLIQKLEPPHRIIRIQPQHPYITEFGFLAALRFLYGAPLLTPADFMHELSQASYLDFAPHAPAARAMNQVLGYISSGYFLELSAVVGAGLECARHLQRWDTVSTSLTFALHGGLNQWWRSIANPEERQTNAEASEPTFGDASSQLLQDTLCYMAVALPPHFHFSTTAAQLSELPRLPTIVENRPSTANPRLSLIQFGQMAIEDTGRPDFLTTYISSILLSLPFAALKFLFEHPMFSPKAGNRLQLLHEVVKERESRRVKVLQAKRVKESKSTALWEATRWSEQIAELAHVLPGFQLYRVRIDADGSAGA